MTTGLALVGAFNALKDERASTPDVLIAALELQELLLIAFLLFPLFGRLVEGLVKLFTKVARHAVQPPGERESSQRDGSESTTTTTTTAPPRQDKANPMEAWRRLLAGEEPATEEPPAPEPPPTPTPRPRRRPATRPIEERGASSGPLSRLETSEPPSAPMTARDPRSEPRPVAPRAEKLESDLAPNLASRERMGALEPRAEVLGPTLAAGVETGSVHPWGSEAGDAARFEGLGDTAGGMRALAFADLPRDSRGWARALVLREILGPPVSLRPDEDRAP